jgi:hypothetical protein
MTFTFKLETADSAPADPADLQHRGTELATGRSDPALQRFLRVVEVREVTTRCSSSTRWSSSP